jgi:hypothetical protein
MQDKVREKSLKMVQPKIQRRRLSKFNKKTSLMIRNYLTIAWRSLSRNKRTSAINIFGLALGVTCSLLIFLWVQDERKIDGFHANGSRLFQVYERSYFDSKVQAGYATQGLLAGELKRVIPEVQYASGMEYVTAPGTKAAVEAGNKVTKMLGFFAGGDFSTCLATRC